MSNKDYKKLIMVAVNDGKSKGADQSNKFYEMIWDGGSDFTVKYGRVETSSTTISYPYSQWHKKYSEKVKKGYKDVTDMVTVQITQNTPQRSDVGDIKDSKVKAFLTLMKNYMDKLVSSTYSVKADNVSQIQVDKAQAIIDILNGNSIKSADINGRLIELYTIIPRKMGNVKDYLLPHIKLENILEQEQDNLDAMAAQVSQVSTTKKATKDKQITGTLLDLLGITMSEATRRDASKDIDYLLNQSHGKKIEAIFHVNKSTEDANYDTWIKGKKNKTSKILIHGTRCTSVVPILEQSLKIRPAGNFQFSGKAYGDGNYFSEVMQKSLNYVGNDNDKVLLVYEVHTGNPFVYDGWFRGNTFPLNLKELESRGFDSTYVKAGNGMLNSEIIAYSEKQNHIKYIIWLKN